MGEGKDTRVSLSPLVHVHANSPPPSPRAVCHEGRRAVIGRTKQDTSLPLAGGVSRWTMHGPVRLYRHSTFVFTGRLPRVSWEYIQICTTGFFLARDWANIKFFSLVIHYIFLYW